MSPRSNCALCANLSFPRVSGDEPAGAGLLWDGIQFSPRERG